jgi:hypothetical protein
MEIDDMTKAELWEKARNRWYKLSIVLTESDCTISSVSLAIKSGFNGTDALYKYFKTWGNRMMSHYGKLPYRKMNSSAYEKYMEMK